jgi:hypothetical protein
MLLSRLPQPHQRPRMLMLLLLLRVLLPPPPLLLLPRPACWAAHIAYRETRPRAAGSRRRRAARRSSNGQHMFMFGWAEHAAKVQVLVFHEEVRQLVGASRRIQQERLRRG